MNTKSPTSLSLTGLPVKITVSEPWEFGTMHGTGPFAGQILFVGSDPNRSEKRAAALVRLDKPLFFEGVICEFFVAQPRLKDQSIETITTGASVECGLTCISTERARSANPLDLSWWRGGVGLTGSLGRA